MEDKMKSESIAKLAEALAKAQRTMEHAKKDSLNPHFKNKYADIASVIEAVREPLAANGLSYVQYEESRDNERYLVTELMHISGEWVRGEMKLLFAKNDMQGLGSALTYARRYSLSAMVGIAQDDDDANTATNKPKPQAKPEWKFGPEQVSELENVMKSVGCNKDFIKTFCIQSFKKEVHQLNESEYKNFIIRLNSEVISK
jgi:hypothetical protein